MENLEQSVEEFSQFCTKIYTSIKEGNIDLGRSLLPSWLVDNFWDSLEVYSEQLSEDFIFFSCDIDWFVLENDLSSITLKVDQESNLSLEQIKKAYYELAKNDINGFAFLVASVVATREGGFGVTLGGVSVNERIDKKVVLDVEKILGMKAEAGAPKIFGMVFLEFYRGFW